MYLFASGQVSAIAVLTIDLTKISGSVSFNCNHYKYSSLELARKGIDRVDELSRSNENK